MSSILELARTDARNIINNGGFETELTITPTGAASVVMKGLATRHNESFNTDGLPVSNANIHCTINEKDLNDLGVVTRDARKELDIKGWKVSWADNIDTYEYSILEPYPDNTLGVIRCILGKS